MTSTTTVSFEIATDTEIARLQFEIGRVGSRVDGALAAIQRLADLPSYAKSSLPRVQAAAEAAEAALPGLRAEAAELFIALRAEQAKYTGWTRYYLVNNSNGHLHLDIASNSCSSCFPTTEYKWITQASGLNEAELVELAGERCCTVCFPSAPVEKKADRIFRSDQEIAAEQRAAERAAAQAKKNEKAINPDGSELRITCTTSSYDERLKTIVSTANFYADRTVEALRVAKYSNEGGRNASLIADYEQQAEQALVALAKRSGVEVEAKRAELAKKVSAKIKRELG